MQRVATLLVGLIFLLAWATSESGFVSPLLNWTLMMASAAFCLRTLRAPSPMWLLGAALVLRFLSLVLSFAIPYEWAARVSLPFETILSGSLFYLVWPWLVELRHSGKWFRLALILVSAALALFFNFTFFLFPLLALPVFRQLRKKELRKVLPWLAITLIFLMPMTWLYEISQSMSLVFNSASFNENSTEFVSEGEHRLPLASILALSTLLMIGSLTVSFGRFLRNAPIRTKLVSGTLLTGVVPMVLLGAFFISLSFVVLGSYRARLVHTQLQQHLDTSELVTSWFAQAWSDPLDHAAQEQFEARIQSLGSDNPIGRAFFSLYIPEGDEHRRLISTWRRPSDFPLDNLTLPENWMESQTSGIIHLQGKLYHVVLVPSGDLLAMGCFPVDQELLETVASGLGSDMRIVLAPEKGVPFRFALSQIGLPIQANAKDLIATPDFPSADASFSDRLFCIGLVMLDDEDFVLHQKENRLVAQVEVLPRHLLPTIFENENSLISPYILVLVVLAIISFPLLLMGVWLAWLLNRRILSVVRDLKFGTDALAQGNLDVHIPSRGGDELSHLARSFNSMTRRLRVSVQEQAKKKQLERDLKLAHSIQQSLLPNKLPKFGDLDIACSCQMAREVGGDYYDFLSMPNGTLALALGDVSGKGMGAALLMSNLQAAWRHLAHDHASPAKINRRLNEQMATTTADEHYITFFHGLIEKKFDGLWLTTSNAGHNPPLLLRDGSITPLSEGGLALGMFDGVSYEEEKCHLLPDDLLVFYTDGVSEAQNPLGDEYGDDRLENLMMKIPRSKSAQGVHDALLKSVSDFVAGGDPVDDLTLMVVRVPNHEKPKLKGL